jgi:hypothetical protein
MMTASPGDMSSIAVLSRGAISCKLWTKDIIVTGVRINLAARGILIKAVSRFIVGLKQINETYERSMSL